MTEVMAAAQKMIPKMRTPQSPSAAWNACAVGFAVCEVRSRVTPAATTPRTARKRTKRISAGHQRCRVERAAGDLAETCLGPVMPLSSSRWAPA